jgi:hypothetical protein
LLYEVVLVVVLDQASLGTVVKVHQLLLTEREAFPREGKGEGDSCCAERAFRQCSCC